MKKIFLVFTILFAFSINCNAQTQKAVVQKNNVNLTQNVVEEKLSFEAKAQKNIAELSSFLSMTPEMTLTLTQLFTTKFKMLEKVEGLAIERRQYINTIIERKLESTLDSNSFEKIKSNKQLFKNLVD